MKSDARPKGLYSSEEKGLIVKETYAHTGTMEMIAAVLS